jgi:hypothetical protein
MYDQSFGVNSLLGLFRDGDRAKIPNITGPETAIATAAAREAENLFGTTNPLEPLHVRGKEVFRPSTFQVELILRKITQNLRHSFRQRSRGRRFIVETLVAHLAEGLPYRIYKRDVYHFYPSFVQAEVQSAVESYSRISRLTKRLLERIFDGHRRLGGSGLPLGLGLSAALSELMMLNFDNHLRSHPNVRFYARYVDDIVLVTNGSEPRDEFSRMVASALPRGLRFNALKNLVRETDPEDPATARGIAFSYLGYSIAVKPSSKRQRNETGREVEVDLSPAKTKKIKTRIVRALHSHVEQPDFQLLKKRLTFLASNTSLPAAGQSVKRLIGIYHTYPLITLYPGCMLYELDRFLRFLVLSGNGRLTSKLRPLLGRDQRSQLLSISFVGGFQGRRFVHVSRTQLSEIRKCWMNE